MIAPNQRAPARFVSNESAAAGEDQDVPARLPRLVPDLGQLANVVEGMPVPASSSAAARADGAAPATGTPALVHAWWHAGGAAELLEDPERALSADSCASLRLAMGVPLELVSETVGHSPRTSTAT
jgi:hypothetical protein